MTAVRPCRRRNRHPGQPAQWGSKQLSQRCLTQPCRRSPARRGCRASRGCRAAGCRPHPARRTRWRSPGPCPGRLRALERCRRPQARTRVARPGWHPPGCRDALPARPRSLPPAPKPHGQPRSTFPPHRHRPRRPRRAAPRPPPSAPRVRRPPGRRSRPRRWRPPRHPHRPRHRSLHHPRTPRGTPLPQPVARVAVRAERMRSGERGSPARSPDTADSREGASGSSARAAGACPSPRFARARVRSSSRGRPAGRAGLNGPRRPTASRRPATYRAPRRSPCS